MATKTQTHKYKRGDIVSVYEDPVTKQRLEGTACIVDCARTADYYRVRFLDEDKSLYYRFIY